MWEELAFSVPNQNKCVFILGGFPASKTKVIKGRRCDQTFLSGVLTDVKVATGQENAALRPVFIFKTSFFPPQTPVCDCGLPGEVFSLHEDRHCCAPQQHRVPPQRRRVTRDQDPNGPGAIPVSLSAQSLTHGHFVTVTVISQSHFF